MRTTLILIILLTSVIFCQAQYAKELDDKNGFNRFKLGQSLSEVKKLAKLKSRGYDATNSNIAFYEVKNIEEFKIFEYPLKGIALYFYKGNLYGIDVYPLFNYGYEKNQIVHQDIIKRVQKEYGGFEQKEPSALDKIDNITAIYEVYGKKVKLRFLEGPSSYFFSDIAVSKEIKSEDKSGL